MLCCVQPSVSEEEIRAAVDERRAAFRAASSGLIELLGEKLLTGSAEAPTAHIADVLGGKQAVALYFSAHWCPPCRGFTPQFAEWYKEALQEKGLEVVFVSSDRDEDAFNEYFGEMPWLALPYSDRARKDKLSMKFKVAGIPTIVILGADGKLICQDGRSAISRDPTGVDFPWTPKTLSEILAGAKFIGKGGPVDMSVLDGKFLGLYFSAIWCPSFTPKLAEWYSKRLKAKGLEIVWVSSDYDEESFEVHYEEQPWLALAYECRKEKEQLIDLYGIEGDPTLVIIDKDGATITRDGLVAVSTDPECAEFPWYPKPVIDVAFSSGLLNYKPVVIALAEASSVRSQQAAVEAMTPMAEKYLGEAKAAGEQDPKVGFMIAKAPGSIASRVREMTSLPEVMEGKTVPPKLMLVSVPDDGAYFEGPEGEITEVSVENLVGGFLAGALQRKQLLLK